MLSGGQAGTYPGVWRGSRNRIAPAEAHSTEGAVDPAPPPTVKRTVAPRSLAPQAPRRSARLIVLPSPRNLRLDVRSATAPADRPRLSSLPRSCARVLAPSCARCWRSRRRLKGSLVARNPIKAIPRKVLRQLSEEARRRNEEAERRGPQPASRRDLAFLERAKRLLDRRGHSE